MLVAEPFGQHFAQLLACPRTSRETPEPEGSETGHPIWSAGTRVALRLTADVADLVRQVAGEAVIEVGHQGRFIGALRKSEHDKQSTEDMQHHVQAIVGVLRVMQSHGVAIEVNGVGCGCVTKAEHPGEQGRGVGGDIVKGGGQICGGDCVGLRGHVPFGICGIIVGVVEHGFNLLLKALIHPIVREACQPYEHLVTTEARKDVKEIIIILFISLNGGAFSEVSILVGVLHHLSEQFMDVLTLHVVGVLQLRVVLAFVGGHFESAAGKEIAEFTA
ncbi:methyl-accepting chemotaxis, putative [Babesia ovata]|uniref:Methyl-accepting chemotaxis, putative n=1 Tax=Babesia ovata TaxID=189622 RepID=A0A2H6KIS7_9APIC|nr:methyl-accepting chemotaxis, putative [Babesia ovata]GBE62887.1 methyl-accepting chemotaxis, putative [Babesia ovata]